MISNETQSEDVQELKCSECYFRASNDSDLNRHMGNSHGWSVNQSNDNLDYS